MNESLFSDGQLELERILLAFTLPHRGHNGKPDTPGDSCPRCNAERALERLFARAYPPAKPRSEDDLIDFTPPRWLSLVSRGGRLRPKRRLA